MKLEEIESEWEKYRQNGTNLEVVDFAEKYFDRFLKVARTAKNLVKSLPLGVFVIGLNDFNVALEKLEKED